MSDEVVYHHAPKSDDHGHTTTAPAVKVEPEEVEKSERGLFGFLGKKEEEKKCEEAEIASEFEEKVHVSKPESKSEEKKESLLEKLHRSDSSSSSSSDEETEDGEKKKKKKPLKEKIKGKIDEHKEKKEEEKIDKHEDDTCVPIEKYEEIAVPPPATEVEPEEKKGFIEKIKEKLPGSHKKTEEEHTTPPPPAAVTHDEYAHPPPPAADTHTEEGEHKEKKGILEKIKEKIPGYHSKTEEEKKEKEKEKECD